MAKNKAQQEELPAEDTGPQTRKRCVGITDDAAITIKVSDNPKRAGSKARDVFQLYLDQNPGTVKEAIEIGIGRDHLAYDHIHGFIEIAGASVEEYEVKPRGPRSADDAQAATAEDEAGDGF